MPASHAIVFFDGVCNLCNGFVNYIISHDKKKYFLFASLQSPQAAELLKKHHTEANVKQGVMLLENDKLYFRSTAGLRILKKLDGLHAALYIFIIVPAFIRNFFYDFIANHRYGWFGKKDECMVPDGEIRNRFIS